MAIYLYSVLSESGLPRIICLLSQRTLKSPLIIFDLCHWQRMDVLRGALCCHGEVIGVHGRRLISSLVLVPPKISIKMLRYCLQLEDESRRVASGSASIRTGASCCLLLSPFSAPGKQTSDSPAALLHVGPPSQPPPQTHTDRPTMMMTTARTHANNPLLSPVSSF